MTHGKEKFNELNTTMKFLKKDNELYKFVYYDGAKNVCKYEKPKYPPRSPKPENTITYEQACKDYNIEFIETQPKPDEYFLTKIGEPDCDIKETINNRTLIQYLLIHKDECVEALNKLQKFANTDLHDDIRKIATKVCREIGIKCDGKKVDESDTKRCLRMFAIYRFMKKKGILSKQNYKGFNNIYKKMFPSDYHNLLDDLTKKEQEKYIYRIYHKYYMYFSDNRNWVRWTNKSNERKVGE